MSDYLIIRGIDAAPANQLLSDWAKLLEWSRTANVGQSWEAWELFINGKNAVKFMRGKHKQELAQLVLLLNNNGARVIHVMLRDDQRREVDLGEWASKAATQ